MGEASGSADPVAEAGASSSMGGDAERDGREAVGASEAEVKDDSEIVEQQGQGSWTVTGEPEAGPSRTNGAASGNSDDLGEMHDDGIDPSDSVDPLDVMDEDEEGGEAIMSDDGDAGPAHDGKRVKVRTKPAMTSSSPILREAVAAAGGVPAC